jgi:pyruvate dehydrogenase E1 component alpha subunit
MATDPGTVEAYELMLQSRVFDEFCEDLEDEGVSVPHLHSGRGQEALMVGSVIDLDPDDYFLYTHRGYGHLLAKGFTPYEILSDAFFKRSGTNEGFGGIMQINDPERGVVGRPGVFGSRFGIAAGIARAIENRDQDRVVVCNFGEAMGSRGPFFEAVNMAALWDLPVVYIGEHNGFSINSRTEDLYAPGNMSEGLSGFDIPVERFDGNDVEETREHVSRAVERARAGDGPSILEGFTYRIPPHVPNEVIQNYRDASEVEEWRERDPIRRTREALTEAGELTENEDQRLHAEFRSEIEDAYERVTGESLPPTGEIDRHVYYEGGPVQ